MLKHIISGSLLVFGSAIAFSLPLNTPIASAQSFCPETDNLSPSKTLRTAEFKQFGIRVQIPANFRTLLRNDGSVSILAPGDFNLIQCLAKGIPVKGTDAINWETFQLHPNADGLSLDAFRSQKISNEEAQLGESQFDGVKVLTALSQNKLNEVAQGFYIIDGIDGVVEISTSNQQRLSTLIGRLEAIAPKKVAAEPTESRPTQSSTTDPVLVALKEIGVSSESRKVTIVREITNLNQAIVTITREGIQDDSIGGFRSRVTLQKDGNGDWIIKAIQRSQKCQPGRGSQTYGSSSCI